MKTVRVNASKEYDVMIGGGLLPRAGGIVKDTCGGEAAVIVTDDNVDLLYGETLARSLAAAGYRTARFVFPNGERSKNMETYVSLLNFLTENKLARTDAVVALGGGVAGDLAGFAAATYLRGVKFAQIPTTLLAMADSSVGGKTAVNLPAGKNQAGAFYQPDVVICDPETLRTLPEIFFTDGCAEMIKHGIILNAELFELLKEPFWPNADEIIARNVSIKSDIVAADEKESGVRRILNFGHTVGHGVEKLNGYAVTHGRAVAIGMAVVSRGAARIGLCGEDCSNEIIDVLTRFGLPHATDIPAKLLAEAALADKKRSGRRIALALPERIGKCVIKDFDTDELEGFIKLGTDG